MYLFWYSSISIGSAFYWEASSFEPIIPWGVSWEPLPFPELTWSLLFFWAVALSLSALLSRLFIWIKVVFLFWDVRVLLLGSLTKSGFYWDYDRLESGCIIAGEKLFLCYCRRLMLGYYFDSGILNERLFWSFLWLFLLLAVNLLILLELRVWVEYSSEIAGG